MNDVLSSVAVNYPQKPVYLPIELVQHKVARPFILLRPVNTFLSSTPLSPGFHERIMVTTNMTTKFDISERGFGAIDCPPNMYRSRKEKIYDHEMNSRL